MKDATRPTKKQRELLNFLNGFIKGNGYGPSYREVMRALEYKSVSTVATHIDGLIARGYLRKRDHSARSLEIVTSGGPAPLRSNQSSHERWLVDQTARLLAEGISDDDRTVLLRARVLLVPPEADESKNYPACLTLDR